MTNTVRQALERDSEVDAVTFVRRAAMALGRLARGWRAPKRADDTTPAAVGTDSTTAAIRRGAEVARHEREGRDDAETT